jgi:hypothetical protein
MVSGSGAMTLAATANAREALCADMCFNMSVAA